MKSLPTPDPTIVETDNCPFTGPLTAPGQPQNSEIITENSSPPVTTALVERVADRMAAGFPLELALAGESVGRADYEQQLRLHPELAALANVARRKFLQSALGMLLNAKDSSANIRWLLERLYPEVFSRDHKTEEVKPGDVKRRISPLVGMSDEEYLRLVEQAAKL